MELKTYFAIDGNARVIPFVNFYVYYAGTEDLATGLEDENGNPLGNPFSSGATGKVFVAAPNGNYDIKSVKGGVEYTERVQFNDVSDSIAAVEDAADRAESAAQLVGDEVAAATKIVLDFIADGTTSEFDIGVDPGSKNNTDVFVNGYYTSKSDYEVSGTILQFITAPDAGLDIEVVIGPSVQLLTGEAENIRFNSGGKVFSVQDLSDATDPEKGAGMVGRSVMTVKSVNELRGVQPRYDGQKVSTLGHSVQGIGAGDFVATYGNYTAQVLADPLGGVYVAFPSGASSGAWVRSDFTHLRPEWFGAQYTLQTNDSSFEAAVNLVSYLKGYQIYLTPTKTYEVSTLPFGSGGVYYTSDEYRVDYVLAFTTPAPVNGAVIKLHSTAADPAIKIDRDQLHSGLLNLFIDAEDVSGDVMVLDDTGTGSTRGATLLQNIIIYKGGAGKKQLHIKPDHKGVVLRQVMLRGGDSRGSCVTSYGLHSESQDSQFYRVIPCFHLVSGVLEEGGTSRYTWLETFQNYGSGMVMNNSSGTYMIKPIFSGNGDHGLEAYDCQFANLSQPQFWENAQETSASDFITSGCRQSNSMSQPIFRGSAGNAQDYAIEDVGSVNVGTTSIWNMDNVSYRASGYGELCNTTASVMYEVSGVMAGITRSGEYLSRKLLNDSPSFLTLVDGLPKGVETYLGGSVAVVTEGAPPSYPQWLKVTSNGTSERSGARLVLDPLDVAGKDLLVKFIARPSGGATSSGNQRVVIVDSDGETTQSASVDLPNDGVRRAYGVRKKIRSSATSVSVRITADRSGTSILDLYIGGLTIEAIG